MTMGFTAGDLPAGAASAASPASSSCAATAAPASPCGTASSSETRAAASEAGSAAALCWPRSETGVPTGTSAPWASPSRGSADDASVWRSAPDRSWQTGTGFPESSRTPRRPRDGSPLEAETTRHPSTKRRMPLFFELSEIPGQTQKLLPRPVTGGIDAQNAHLCSPAKYAAGRVPVFPGASTITAPSSL